MFLGALWQIGGARAADQVAPVAAAAIEQVANSPIAREADRFLNNVDRAGTAISELGSGIHRTLFDSAGGESPATGNAGAPSPRNLHTAVWTGSLMVVWGGAQTNGLNTSGARYEPVSASWTPTATPNGQTGRKNHSAVWTGSEMLVWGGFDTLPPNYLNSGGRYDPTLDTWSDFSLVGAPSPRELHQGVWAGTGMVIWGGFTGTQYVNTGGRYDPVSDSWFPTSLVDAPSPRQFPSSIWSGRCPCSS